MSRSESPTFNALTFNALSITAFCCVKSRIYNTKRPHPALQDTAVIFYVRFQFSSSAIHLSIVFVSRLKFIPNLITLRPSALKGGA